MCWRPAHGRAGSTASERRLFAMLGFPVWLVAAGFTISSNARRNTMVPTEAASATV